MQIENREEAQRSILQMCRGAFQERVDYEMPHLMENTSSTPTQLPRQSAK